MAAKPSASKKQKPKHNKKSQKQPKLVQQLDSLKWNSSLPISEEDDPFSSTEFLTGEGGFLSLEEIDESDYKLVLHDSNNKNRKHVVPDGEEEEEVVLSEEKKEKKPKKKKKKTNEIALDGDKDEDKVVEDEVVFDENEFNAWNELRLHPLLMKAIYKQRFKEPTPIQKVCIPAAAHQGNDVIGAAETGSGKTLALGLPILQRLLQEREKFAKSLSEKGNEDEDGVHESSLRDLIVTPTRELALQVAGHIKEVAKFINVRVVPIVGGMSTKK